MRRLGQDAARARRSGSWGYRRVRVRPAALLALLGLLLGGCDGGTVTVEVAPVRSVIVDVPDSTIHEQDTMSLRAIPRDAEGRELTGRTVTWSSSNDSRATVDNRGVVTGVAAGPVTIRARVEGVEGQASLTVAPIPVASVMVSPSSGSVEVGLTLQLTATPRDAGGAPLIGRMANWSSSNTSRATVDGSGRVTGIAAGTVTITATSDGRNGSATVMVTSIPVANVTVSPSSGAVEVGSTLQLAATSRDANGTPLTGRTVTWQSSNTSLAVVSDSGLVTGVSPGNVGIIATVENRAAEARIAVGGNSIVMLSSGGGFSCGFSLLDVVYCWSGTSPGGEYDRPVLGGAHSPREPVAIDRDRNFSFVDAGVDHACALTQEGTALCWGSGDWGQLGHGAYADSGEPVSVAGNRGFRQISAGYQHTCAVTKDDRAYCWGDGREGQLAIGTSELGWPYESPTPMPVVDDHRFVEVSAGTFHTCGLTRQGAAYCWGDGWHGELGTGQSRARSAVPVPVAGGHRFVAISTGSTHTCAVNAEGRAYCWGSNAFGQLGNGSDRISEGAPVAVAGDLRFRSISSGLRHTCGVTSEGTGYCWGAELLGMIGGSDRPVDIWPGSRWLAIESGGSHACGNVEDGLVYCWGGGFGAFFIKMTFTL